MNALTILMIDRKKFYDFSNNFNKNEWQSGEVWGNVIKVLHFPNSK